MTRGGLSDTGVYSWRVDTRQAAKRWAQVWERGWPEHDASASAQTRLTDGGTEDLAGVSVLRFRADGLVVEERDFWNQG
jgi:hypothetical protein